MALPETTPEAPRFADAFVIFSVTILSLAIGAWFLLRLQLPLWSGTVAALAVYTVLLALHLAVRRSLLSDPAPADGGGWVSHAMARAEAERAAAGPAAAEAPPRPEAGTVPPPRVPDEEARRWGQAAVPDPRELGPGRTPDPFHFRPLREPGQAAPAGRTPVAQPQGPGRRAEAPPEVSVEAIQDLIKKLADELNTAPGGERAGPKAQSAPPDARRARPEPPPARRGEPRPPAPSEGKSARDVRPPAWPRAEAPQETGASPAVPPALNPQVGRIAEAVAAQRMEVLLEPIHALAEGRPRHVEISLRLITADGTALEQAEIARAARGTGLMARIDAARMVRTARVARRLGDRGRQGSVLTLVDASSLTDEAFLACAAAEPGKPTGMNLVLSFAQGEVRTFAPGHVQALKRLASVGLRFALEEMTDLDMDFAALKAMGLEFVKLDAPSFLEGLPGAGGGRVPASDICRLLADFGLTVIVGRIEDDWLLARILGFGVLFGKGTLFGGPKLVKPEVVAAAA